MIKAPMEIRVLTDLDAQAWWDLRLEALQSDPLAFGKSVEEHLATPVETIARRFRDTATGNFTLGAFEDGQLVGMATFVRSTGFKDRHKGHIYGVYVSASQRGKGAGRALLSSLIEKASQDLSLEQILLAVGTAQTAARALYRALGFESFGIEPRGYKQGSTYVDEDHMILWLHHSEQS